MDDINNHDATLAGVFGPMQAPHDRLSFEELAAAYNFRKTSNWQGVFTRLLIDEARRRERPVRVLDIGCGKGIARRPEYTAEVRKVVDEFWGIEPDKGITPPEGTYEHFQHALLEDAALPESHFDIAYSFMVVEHVARPRPFMEAVARTLKPGGVHFFITVNGRHHFAHIALNMKRLKVDELVLRMVRKGDEVEEYHYPVQYRMNTRRAITRVAHETGFDTPEFVYLEEEGPKPYFPGPLRPVYHALRWKRSVLKNSESLLTMICRMRKRDVR